MESTKSDYLVPENIKGKHTDVEHSVTLNSNQEAITLFSKACNRILDINKWHKIIGFASAQFSIKDNRGVHSNSLSKVDDYIEIDVPGPGPSSGDGFDWVEVELIDDHSDSNAEEESMGMRVRSAKIRKRQLLKLPIFSRIMLHLFSLFTGKTISLLHLIMAVTKY